MSIQNNIEYNEDNINVVSENSKKTLTRGIGFSTIFFILGLICLIFLVYDFEKLLDKDKFSHFFDSKDDTSNLCGLISVSTGLFWSIAGVILYAASLIQAKQEITLQINEMKTQSTTFNKQMLAIEEQNQTSILQQQQNTLNFIITNHTNLIKSIEYTNQLGKKFSSYEALHQLVQRIMEDFNSYTQHYDNLSFPSLDYLKYQYEYYFKSFKSERNITNMIFNNFLLSHEFISSNFTTSLDLYFKILDNSYSLPEKYIIGMYLVNEKEKYSDVQLPYDFTYYYRETTEYEKSIYELPIINIQYFDSPITQTQKTNFNNYDYTIPFIDKLNDVLSKNKFKLKFLLEVNKLNKSNFIEYSSAYIHYTYTTSYIKTISQISVHDTNKNKINNDGFDFEISLNEIIKAMLKNLYKINNDKHEDRYIECTFTINIEIKVATIPIKSTFQFAYKGKFEIVLQETTLVFKILE